MHNTQKFHFSTFIVVCNIPVLIVFNDSSWNKVNVTIHSLIVCYNNSNFLNGSVTFFYLTYYRIIVIFILRKVTVSLLIIDYYFQVAKESAKDPLFDCEEMYPTCDHSITKIKKKYDNLLKWFHFIFTALSSYNLCA